MKYIYPKLLFICLSVAIYCNNKPDSKNRTNTSRPNSAYALIVKRGAFHNDRFEITKNKIRYIPEATSIMDAERYNSATDIFLDSISTIGFFKKIEADGFWKLKSHYSCESTCTNQLIITLKVNEKSKTVICDDFERDCPDLIKYIDRKIVELHGQDLRRIYMPG